MTTNHVRTVVRFLIKIILAGIVIFLANAFFQFSQNNGDLNLVKLFIFNWHTALFIGGCLVLALILILLIGLSGLFYGALSLFGLVAAVIGFINYQKMSLRNEPLYPDDFKMITELGMLKELVDARVFYGLLALSILCVVSFVYAMQATWRKQRNWQRFGRVLLVLVALGGLFYVSQFNQKTNRLRLFFNRYALWISYSQEMNYYNNGFIGGFLYNLEVEPMAQPKGYSAATVQKIVKKYAVAKKEKKPQQTEQPNIVYIMNESFSDPRALSGITAQPDPLANFRELQEKALQGWSLSQNFGGGTANIEFEALTGISTASLNSQLTTPYTMLVPKLKQLPSAVSFLKGAGYQTTAIHPYNTSMYKRKDVYQKLGFDQFIDEETISNTKKISDNPYISDEAAYDEVLLQLKKQTKPAFIHLVTMQNHMPYSNKYPDTKFTATGNDDNIALANYYQDLAYSSQALQKLFTQLATQTEHTIVVFWGDHLPSVYDKKVQAKNSFQKNHSTPFVLYDNQQTNQDFIGTISPVYFLPEVLNYAQQKTSGYYRLLTKLQAQMPAFDKQHYVDGKQMWQNKRPSKNTAAQKLYQDYQMILYDVLVGKNYSLSTDFFKAQ